MCQGLQEIDGGSRNGGIIKSKKVKYKYLIPRKCQLF